MFDQNAKVFYPVAGFYFEVEINGMRMPFQEVSGLDVKREIIEIAEGGINDYVHRVPGRTKYQNLILKKGVIRNDTELAYWCQNTIQSNLNNPIIPKNITIHLLDAYKEVGASSVEKCTVMGWDVKRAYPVRWSVSNLNAQENQIAVESLELAFQKFEIFT